MENKKKKIKLGFDAYFAITLALIMLIVVFWLLKALYNAMLTESFLKKHILQNLPPVDIFILLIFFVNTIALIAIFFTAISSPYGKNFNTAGLGIIDIIKSYYQFNGYANTTGEFREAYRGHLMDGVLYIILVVFPVNSFFIFVSCTIYPLAFLFIPGACGVFCKARRKIIDKIL